MRRIAGDDELREDFNDFIRSANSIMTHVRSDKRLGRDVRHMLQSAQSGAGHLRGDVRPRHFLRRLVVGTGLIITSLGVGIAVAWPRTRRQLTRVADQTTQRASATVHDVRERISGPSEERAA